MATRRISSACIASTTRNAFTRTTRSHQLTLRFLTSRQLSTTSIRYEQQKANTSAKRDPAPKIVRGASKVYKNADAAVADIESGAVILSAGFGICGTAGGCLSIHMHFSVLTILLYRDDHRSNREARKEWTGQSHSSIEQCRIGQWWRPVAPGRVWTNRAIDLVFLGREQNFGEEILVGRDRN